MIILKLKNMLLKFQVNCVSGLLCGYRVPLGLSNRENGIIVSREQGNEDQSLKGIGKSKYSGTGNIRK